MHISVWKDSFWSHVGLDIGSSGYYNRRKLRKDNDTKYSYHKQLVYTVLDNLLPFYQWKYLCKNKRKRKMESEMEMEKEMRKGTYKMVWTVPTLDAHSVHQKMIDLCQLA